ncbi:MAG: hypothetical protein AAGG50_13190 [Bacteroidota bacterium]
MALTEQIAALDDARAIAFVRTLADAHSFAAETTDLASVQDALAAEVEGTDLVVAPASEGALARTALLLFAEDPEMAPRLESLLDAGPVRSFVDPGTAIGLTVAALIVLQTHVRFYRDKEGKWTLKVEKKPTDTSLLKKLMAGILGLGKGE